MVRAVVAESYGGPEVIGVIEAESRPPEPDEVVVRVSAAALNPWDLKMAQGAMGRDPARLPLRLGMEAAGVVRAAGPDAVGADGSPLRPGEAVFGNGLSGAQASELTVPAAKLLRIPDGVPHEAAAGVLTVGTTAVHGLEVTGVGEGDVVLVHGGAGGVGRMVVQLARRRGARVIATASPARHADLERLGAEPVEYGEGLAGRVRALAPDGIDAAFDTVGTDEALRVSLDLLADPARFVTIVAFQAALDAGGKAIGAGPGADRGSDIRAAARFELARLLAAGELEVAIGATFPLEDARAGYDLLATGHAAGKIILTP